MEALTNNQLKMYLKQHGLKISGSKADLTKRVLRRICPTDTAFNKHSDELAEHLKKKGYKEKLIFREINKAKGHKPREIKH